MKKRTFIEYVRDRLMVAGSWLGRHSKPVRIVGWSLLGLIGIPLLGLFLLPYALWPFAPDLDRSQDLYAANRPVAFTFLDASGKVAGRQGALVGERLKLEDMPSYLPDAFVAMEDRRYYNHIGIDSVGILRALVTDVLAGQILEGGSTISQQTAKIVFTDSERSFSRKFRDMMGALSLEKALSKKQILELYLNRIYLGSGAYGVDGAARIYFGKSARHLSVAEAAMLATLTAAPSAFSPRRDLRRAQKRAAMVLSVMQSQGVITEDQANEARAHPAAISNLAMLNARNYYLDMALDEALRRIQLDGKHVTSDLTIRTMLVPKIQNKAAASVRSVIDSPRGAKAKASEAAVVVMRPDGGVAAMIGGLDYAESSFNRATQAHRQPGSSFKPFVYLAALEAGMTPYDTREDVPVSVGDWTPRNFGGHEYGTVTLTQALARSVNTIAVQVAQEVGVDAVIEAAKRCGIASPLRGTASLALGTSEVTPMEMTRAYATFASGGLRVYPYFVTEVTDASGKVLYRRKDGPRERVIASHVMQDLTAMLYAVVTEGTGGRAGLWDHEVAGKTGTTQDYHDAWFVGFSADYATAVWVGNDDASPMRGVTGGSLPAEIWRDVMRTAEKGLPAKPLDRSTLDEDVETAPIDVDLPELRTESDAPEAAAPAKKKTESGKGFWGWLFGSGDENKAKPAEGGNSGGDAD